MTQFAVYKNKNAATKTRIPYLLDVQSGLLDGLETRLVIPLAPLTLLKGKVVTKLMPTVDLEGKIFVLLTPQMAGISRKDLGASVCDVSFLRDEIIAAVDLLVTGI